MTSLNRTYRTGLRVGGVDDEAMTMLRYHRHALPGSNPRGTSAGSDGKELDADDLTRGTGDL